MLLAKLESCAHEIKKDITMTYVPVLSQGSPQKACGN